MEPEDTKIVTLARSARQRAHVPYSGVAEGAAEDAGAGVGTWAGGNG